MMKIGTITGTLATPVVLGTDQYGSTLTVVAGAVIAVSGTAYDGDAAITAPSSLSSASVFNNGTLEGAPGLRNSQAGDGILLETNGLVRNAGTITGGGGKLYGSAGGIGIDLHGFGLINNSGIILGGYGHSTGAPDGDASYGGIGVYLRDGGTITNRGSIEGGAGGSGRSQNGNGGAALALAISSDVVNTGTIAGGSADGFSLTGSSASVGGAGVVFHQGGMLLNTGKIDGGLGAGGIDVANSGSLASAATITNAGTLAGGHGSDGNSLGASDGGNGGFGIGFFGRGGTLSSSGLVIGGLGGSAISGSGGIGGAGVYVGHYTGFAENSGMVAGGAGGASSYATGGAGGAGVSLLSGKLVNRGIIRGGDGGESDTKSGGGAGGLGGVGVYLGAGELIAASGTISGGVAGGQAGALSHSDAVQMGYNIGARLQVDPGAVFVGAIAASYSVDDVLILAGQEAGALAGFGEQGGISGFSLIEEDSGSHWLLCGTITSNTPILMQAHAFLALSGSDEFVPVQFASAGDDVLRLDTPSTFVNSTLVHFGLGDAIQLEGIAATSFSFKADELSLFGSDGATLATLYIPGPYTQADFRLQHISGGTEVSWAGSAMQPEHWHIPPIIY